MREIVPLTLGDIIERLESLKQDEYIGFDFGGLSPENFYSYRGDYSQLALSFKVGSITVKEFLEMCHHINGGVMQGWKGGQFNITKDCLVYVGDWGISSKTVIIGIKELQYDNYIIMTRYQYFEEII